MPRKKAATPNPVTTSGAPRDHIGPARDSWLRGYWAIPREGVIRRGELYTLVELAGREARFDRLLRIRKELEERGVPIRPCKGFAVAWVLGDHLIEDHLRCLEESESESSPAGDGETDAA